MKYEMVAVVTPDQQEKTALDAMTALLEKEGFSIMEKSWWGKKTLAYPIRKFTEANYMFFVIESSKSKPRSLETRFKLDNSILRFLILRKETTRKKHKKLEA